MILFADPKQSIPSFSYFVQLEHCLVPHYTATSLYFSSVLLRYAFKFVDLLYIEPISTTSLLQFIILTVYIYINCVGPLKNNDFYTVMNLHITVKTTAVQQNYLFPSFEFTRTSERVLRITFALVYNITCTDYLSFQVSYRYP